MILIKSIKQALFATLFTLPITVMADGIASLKAFYTDTKTMRADFSQVVTDKQGRKVQEVQGVMQLKRPNKFRWDYNKPFEQQIISDGKQIWLYDTELAQVTVRGISKALGSSPAALLAGGESLEKNFKLMDTARKDNLEWVSALPLEPDSGFEKIFLGFSDSQLQKMELTDSFGHNTSIIFSNLAQNNSISDGIFVFKVPKGVDLIGE